MSKLPPRVGFVSFTDEEEGENGFFSGEITGPADPHGANLAWLNPTPFIEKFAYDDLLSERNAAQAEAAALREEVKELKDQITRDRIEGIKWVESTTRLAKERDALREALQFYAEEKHIQDCTKEGDLEHPSGESPNWLCDSEGKFNLENGGIAREALAPTERGGEREK